MGFYGCLGRCLEYEQSYSIWNIILVSGLNYVKWTTRKWTNRHCSIELKLIHYDFSIDALGENETTQTESGFLFRMLQLMHTETHHTASPSTSSPSIALHNTQLWTANYVHFGSCEVAQSLLPRPIWYNLFIVTNKSKIAYIKPQNLTLGGSH